jgi:hypothetical protein
MSAAKGRAQVSTTNSKAQPLGVGGSMVVPTQQNASICVTSFQRASSEAANFLPHGVGSVVIQQT